MHSFYSNHWESEEIKKIFHYFAKAKVIVYIGKTKTFNNDDIDNKNVFLKLTLDKLESIL